MTSEDLREQMVAKVNAALGSIWEADRVLLNFIPSVERGAAQGELYTARDRLVEVIRLVASLR